MKVGDIVRFQEKVLGLKNNVASLLATMVFCRFYWYKDAKHMISELKSF